MGLPLSPVGRNRGSLKGSSRGHQSGHAPSSDEVMQASGPRKKAPVNQKVSTNVFVLLYLIETADRVWIGWCGGWGVLLIIYYMLCSKQCVFAIG